MLRTTVVFLAVISVTFSAVALMKPDPKPDKYKNIEGCYVKDVDLVIPFWGKAPSKTKCLEYVCSSDYVQIATCGAVAPPQHPCKLVHHDNVKDNPYPKCCPSIEC